MLYLLNIKKYQNKTTKDLWEQDRKWFNLWILGFFVCLLVLLALNIVIIAQYALDASGIKTRYSELLIANSNDVKNADLYAENYWRYGIIDGSINSAIVAITIYSLIHSFILSYRRKSFSSISTWPTLFVFIQAIYSFFSLFKLLIYGITLKTSFEITWANIISFSLSFVYLLTWFIFSRNVALIRRIFFFSEKMSEMNNIYSEMFNNGHTHVHNQESTLNNSTNNSNSENNSDYKNNQTWLRIYNLGDEQLKELAKKLSISGYESMSKDELVKIIFEIYNSQERTTKSKEIEVESSSQKDEHDENKNHDKN